MIQSGKLRHRVELQEDQGTVEGLNGYVESWVTIKPLWVEIKPLSGREAYYANQMQSETTHRIRSRFINNLQVNSKLRLKYGDRIFHVTSVRDMDETRRELHWDCIEKKLP